jgi:hypothetical protein
VPNLSVAVPGMEMSDILASRDDRGNRAKPGD